MFLAIGVISKKVKDRTLLTMGLVGNLSTLVFLIVFVPQLGDKQTDSTKNIVLFMAAVFGNVFSLPFIVLGSISLLSKLTSKHSQGLTQGIRRTVVGIASIIGPIWAGFFYKNWYILFGTFIGILSMSLFMILLSFKYLKPLGENNEANDNNQATSNSSSENTNNNSEEA